MQDADDAILRDSMRAFRREHVEPVWEQLDAPDASAYDALWRALGDMGVTSFGLPEQGGGLALDARARFTVLRELGAAAPALACGVVSHVTAVSLLYEASAGRLPEPLDRATSGAHRFALAGNPLDGAPATEIAIASGDGKSLSGSLRVCLPYPEWLVVPARGSTGLHLAVVPVDAPGARFETRASSHGLGLLPFGTLDFDDVSVPAERVFDWPASGRAANEADGLVASLLAGVAEELCRRAVGHAIDRYQGGKMIHQHDAVQELVGPIELARRPLEASALATLSKPRAGDGGASAFAVEIVRQSGLDAIQTFGGYGYMEDSRVERYTRDANTLETCWIHAAARQRAIARGVFAGAAA